MLCGAPGRLVGSSATDSEGRYLVTLLWIVVAAATVVLLAVPVAGWLGARAGIVLGAALGALGVTTGVLAARADDVLVSEVAWMPSLDVAFALRLDGLSLLFALVVLLIGAVVLIYSATYLPAHDRGGAAQFYVLMTFFAAAMLVLVVADDLVVMFVAWELTTLCSYLLILRSGPQAGPPATRTFLVTFMGGLCLLAAVVLIIVTTGTTSLSAALASPAWAEDPGFATGAAVLIAIAALTKSAQFPFHAWLPDAMVAPAPVSAYLHAAAMVKAGIFLLMRFAPAASHSDVWGPMLITLGLVTAVMGAVFALQRTDLKELLAYSTVSQLGLLVTAVGVGTPLALRAAAVHVVAHALFKSSGFMLVGLLEKRAGSRDIREIGGLARTMPWTTAAAALAAASMAGAPPLIGFVSKEQLLETVVDAPGGSAWLLTLVLAAGAVLTVAYSARLVIGLVAGPAGEVAPLAGKRSMTAMVHLTAFAGLVLGPGVVLVDPWVRDAQQATVGGSHYPLALWHGINTPLVISLVVLALGGALAWQRARVDRLIEGRRLLPWTGVGVAARLQDLTVAGGRQVGRLTASSAPATYLAVPVAVLAALGVAGVVSGSVPLPGGDIVALDVALFVVVCVGTVAVIRARSRLGAVVAAGIVGFTVGVFFLSLGAVDVALTQLLVEILTVVVLVFVLARLPRDFRPTSVLRRRSAGLVAVLAGVAATAATLAFTGRRPLSPAGEYYLTTTQEETGADNVVNSILVDFRAFDTMGELVVLATAALSILALVRARPHARPSDVSTPVRADDVPASRGQAVRDDLAEPGSNALFIAVLARVGIPVMLFGSAFLLLRGHNAPGGGFIGALVGASAFALAYLAAPSDAQGRPRLPYLRVAGGGIVVAVLTGFIGFLEGSFLRPIDGDVLGVHVTTALIFDVGVYLGVLGVILAALGLLGAPADSPDDDYDGVIEEDDLRAFAEDVPEGRHLRPRPPAPPVSAGPLHPARPTSSRRRRKEGQR